MAHRLWILVSQLYSLIDPLLRPLIRSYFAASLRLLINWVPGISQALALDVHSPTITFADVPGAKIVVGTISVRTLLAFTQTEKAEEAARPSKAPPSTRASYSVGAWRRRLTNSVQRSWDRAWGQTHGSAMIEVKLNDTIGSMDSVADSFGRPNTAFLLLLLLF
jgi:hypothetical protein